MYVEWFVENDMVKVDEVGLRVYERVIKRILI